VPGFGVMRSTNRWGNLAAYLLPKPKTPFTAAVTAAEAIGAANDFPRLIVSE